MTEIDLSKNQIVEDDVLVWVRMPTIEDCDKLEVEE